MLDFIKKFLKRWFRNFLAVLSLSYFYPGFETNDKLSTILLAGLMLSIIQIFFHPLLKLLWLPVNVITLGMFSWFLYVIHLLIVTNIISSVNFVAFSYENFNLLGFNLGSGEANVFVSVVIGGIIYTFLNKILSYLTS